MLTLACLCVPGILKSILVNKLTAAGCVFKFWVADWFALYVKTVNRVLAATLLFPTRLLCRLNNKMGGDLKKIQTVGKYMIEVWRAAGMVRRSKWVLLTLNQLSASRRTWTMLSLFGPLRLSTRTCLGGALFYCEVTLIPLFRSSNEYWLRVMDIARKFNVTRVCMSQRNGGVMYMPTSTAL